MGVSEILQALAYIGSLSTLSAIIGMLFKETYDRYTWNGEAAHKVQNIREAIIDSGHVQVDLKIIAMGDHKYNSADPSDWMGSTDVFFETNGKIYEATVKTKPKAVLKCMEATSAGPNNESK